MDASLSTLVLHRDPFQFIKTQEHTIISHSSRLKTIPSSLKRNGHLTKTDSCHAVADQSWFSIIMDSAID